MNAHAKINLALVVGPTRPDGKHEVSTVLQRIELADRIELEPAEQLRVDGFDGDTLVRGALERLAGAAGVDPLWAVLIDKAIPVAAGLGGGSSDAAAALRLANETLDEPLSPEALHALAAELGADVPFFLYEGPQLGEGDGSDLTPLDLPQPYTVLLVIPDGEPKESTRAVYAAFDERRGADGYEHRREQLLAALSAGDVASFPRTTWAPRRWRTSCARWERSEPTSAVPAPPSTGSSTTCRRPRLQEPEPRVRAGFGSAAQRGRLRA